MVDNEEGGSFVDPKEQQAPPRVPPKDSNYKLWELLEQIRDAIKENSVAINNLVSTAFMNRPVELPQRPEIPVPRPLVGHPTTGAGFTQEPLPQKKVDNAMTKIEALFPEDISSMLDFNLDTANGVVVIKPRQFLGSDVFAKVASVVRAANGEYVSAGKGSHFKVPV